MIKQLALAIACFTIVTFAPIAARSQSAPAPYYISSGGSGGSGIQSQNLPGMTGQSLCWASINSQTSAAITISQSTNAAALPIVLYTNTAFAAPVIQPVTIAASTQGFYWFCGNAQSVTITSSTGQFSYVFIATSQSWPYPPQVQTGGQTGGVGTLPVNCNKSQTFSAAAAGTTQIVAAVAGQSIYLCGFIFSEPSTANSLTFVQGTGSACGTGQTNLSPAMATSANNSFAVANPQPILFALSGNALCATNGSATLVIGGSVTYAQF